MKFKFTITSKLALGYVIVLTLILVTGVIIYNTLSKSRQISQEFIQVTSPSLSELNQMFVLINNSKMLIKNWVYIDKLDNTVGKRELKKLSYQYQQIKEGLDTLSMKWTEAEQHRFQQVTKLIEDSLFQYHVSIMTDLRTFDDYNDNVKIMINAMLVEEDGEVMLLTDKILSQLGMLLKDFQKNSKEKNIGMITMLDKLKKDIEVSYLVVVILGFTISFLTVRSLVRPINKLKYTLLEMSKGVLPAINENIRNDEIGEMTVALNEHVLALKRTSEFAKEIGNGNFQTDFEPLGESDILGNALIDMRKNLKEANKKESIRKKEDDQRNWGTRGLAMFGDILRQNNDNISELSYNIISNLVKYLNANQGGMFVIENENSINIKDIELHMMAAYAYDRRKFADKIVRYGEGLIGTCFVEKHTIYMSEIPDSYLNITSGLGKANPRYLLIVPLMINENVYGVIEIASFYKFEKYQIEFVEKVAESIATTISSVKINTRTARLLEESKIQGEQLIQQEEEMRQNLEELQATQEESHRKLRELQTQLDQVNDYIGVIELDFEGNIIYINDYFAELFEKNAYDIIHSNIGTLITNEKELKQFMENFDDFSKGIRKNGRRIYLHGQNIYKMQESYIPKRSEYGDFERVMIFSIREE
jgi:PAS domain-containing protein